LAVLTEEGFEKLPAVAPIMSALCGVPCSITSPRHRWGSSPIGETIVGALTGGGDDAAELPWRRP
jgi:hypothetical protein